MYHAHRRRRLAARTGLGQGGGATDESPPEDTVALVDDDVGVAHGCAGVCGGLSGLVGFGIWLWCFGFRVECRGDC